MQYDFVREKVTPSPIENATVCKGVVDGVHRQYEITPNEGYVLHDNRRDFISIDPETGDITTYLGYTTGMASCAASYDFSENPREFYAVPQDSVPADQIFGGGSNHETA